mmetsp:Transcript_113861/g.284805  ORF Transcript_113861/g.284805 Transcript_113861/m.284805 type:complete len:277 (+) Transcript_113861:620-1450(+)
MKIAGLEICNFVSDSGKTRCDHRPVLADLCFQSHVPLALGQMNNAEEIRCPVDVPRGADALLHSLRQHVLRPTLRILNQSCQTRSESPRHIINNPVTWIRQDEAGATKRGHGKKHDAADQQCEAGTAKAATPSKAGAAMNSSPVWITTKLSARRLLPASQQGSAHATAGSPTCSERRHRNKSPKSNAERLIDVLDNRLGACHKVCEHRNGLIGILLRRQGIVPRDEEMLFQLLALRQVVLDLCPRILHGPCTAPKTSFQRCQRCLEFLAQAALVSL